MKYRVYNAAGIVVFKAVSYDALMRKVNSVFMLSGFIPTNCLVVSPTMAGPLEPQFTNWQREPKFTNWQRYQQSPKPRKRAWNDDILTLDEN